MSEKTENASITVTIPESRKSWLERFAKAMGHVRTHPWRGEEGGNLSWGVKEAVEFLHNHMDQYMAERSKKIVAEFEGGGDE